MITPIFRSFTPSQLPADPRMLAASVPIFTRGVNFETAPNAMLERIAEIQRSGGGQADVLQIVAEMARNMGNVERALNSTNIPVRENLEAEAKILVPMETPMRNKLPRTTGSGVSSQWKTITSLGGGYGAATMSTSSGNTSAQATLTVSSIAGFVLGDTILVGTSPNFEQHVITAISGSTFTLDSNLANTQNSQAVIKVAVQPGGGAAQRAFFPESGAPSNYNTTYASLTRNFKLLGAMGSITGFAMAAGATFQNQLATEKTNVLRNTMLNEENALINAVSSTLLAPWGDGTTNYAYDGLLAQVSTAYGTPIQQIQTNVGQLTLAHIDAQIIKLWTQGAQGIYMLMSGTEISSMAHLGSQSGNYRILLDPRAATLGTAVTGYLHPITGEIIPIIPERFLSPGTILFGCDRLPDGSPAADVEVLPQTQLPELAPNDQVQGYVAQEIAPDSTSPQVYPFMVSCFSVMRVKSSLHFAKSTGVTPV